MLSAVLPLDQALDGDGRMASPSSVFIGWFYRCVALQPVYWRLPIKAPAMSLQAIAPLLFVLLWLFLALSFGAVYLARARAA